MQEYIERVTDGEDLTLNDARDAATAVFEDATDAQIGALLAGLRSKGVMDQHPLARPTHPEVVARIENETRYQR